MQEDKALGKENISRDDLVIPRVALMQAVNPEVTEGKAQSGDFFHTVLEEVLGTEIDDLIIIHHSKRYTLWNPRHLGGGILARASDGVNWDEPNQKFTFAPFKDFPKKVVTYELGTKVGRDIGLGKWGTTDPDNPDSPPIATLTHALVCILQSRPEMGPFVMLLQRSAEPVAKQLLSKVQLDPAPIFGQVYRVGSRVITGDSGDFNQYTFTKNGHVQDADLYTFLKEQHIQFRDTGIKYDEEAERPDTDASTGGDDGNGGDPKY